ncbi:MULTISPECIES: adenylate/guanylate cyclase domain-containing protein [unclassified Bradyrhizobium]|uniref:adenylate/guanylate cyclase domain-containing protein n=1 Tax=unclassified Bradyrhizobium TaxID=2631580 RepID=UPI0024797D14|nr:MULTISPECIES: adenylate/guanylate cyclase domain-containing protein [unclassified Bradyrhizobium]WGR70282.1 adenylate/guanylate cyclase domain-containing protein [Bradyrhizobium sp. ISRA426]WGR82341.1 adenylate/guanylate cyclase domain-containing protein [Bradyrhizobium sp. ISRA430]WGR85526.1 adenylate/guanylate cyclase domain-containing protein [Bradyrhizobium sp. ISRA432]
MPQKPPSRVERRLSAILAADVAGYSRLMHHDEEATHAKLSALLTEVVHPAIAEHGGRIVKNTGDGLLAEFPSAVEAVRAAMKFQTRIKDITAGEVEDRRIAFRVGVNIGDVIVEPHDIFGDDVNIAARLEGIAEPGGICVSSLVYAHVRGKVAIEFADLGEQTLKNIPHAIRAYAMVQGATSPATNDARSGSLSPPRLSIVVLPFANLSGDPEQDYFVDGVTESLTTDLSRIKGSFVIGRHTAFTYKGKALDLKKIGRELNIRYALEGSVQRSENQLRVNVQLVDAETGAHLWADRFDKPISDLFEMQDEIVSRLANALNAQLIAAEARRAERSLHPSALDLYFQGMARWNKGWTPAHLAQAGSFFERALELDPDNVEALVGIAAIDIANAGINFTDNPDALYAAAETALNKALSLAPQYALAHAFLGCVLFCTKRGTEGIAECEHALALNPNLAEAHAFIGVAKYFIGRAEETEAHIYEAIRLSPRDEGAHRWMFWVGFSKLMLGADAEAVVWFRRSLNDNSNFPIAYFELAAALAHLGKLDEARGAVKKGLALNPTFTIRRLKAIPFSDDSTFREQGRRVIQGMRMAGVPEG